MDIIRDDNTITELQAVPGHRTEAADMILCRNIGELLHKHYPGHLWAVCVDSEGGVVVIKNLRVSANYGYLLKINDLYPFDSGVVRTIINAGGEILERASMARGQSDGRLAGHVEGVKHRKNELIV